MKTTQLVSNIKDYKSKFQRAFSDYHASLREALGELDNSDILSSGLTQLLSEALFNNALKADDPMAVYWLDMLDDIFFVAQIHNDIEEGEISHDEGEEELFSFWNDSDYALALQELLKNSPIALASRKLLSVLETQAEAIYQLHFHEHGLPIEAPLFYKPIPEIGDYPGAYYLPRRRARGTLDYGDEFYIHSTKPLKVGPSSETPLTSELTPVTMLDTNIAYHPSDADFAAHEEQELSRIKNAIDHVKRFSPSCSSVFTEFTKVIVPIREQGIVSYSMDNLPGVSCINMSERDYVDLIDDLVHESGHHFLNCILGSSELINEDDEKIFYSPWRKSLRPIRGLYHAVFTFYWAMRLFGDLAHSEVKSELTDEEWQKVLQRTIEEAYMISFCAPQLDEAFKRKKVTKAGRDLIAPILEEAQALMGQVAALKEQLTGESKKAIEDLEKDIAQWSSKYQFN